MGEKLIVGPVNRGIRTDREAFIIDNDSFPLLINAYQWRGRIKRKRGTGSFGRLQRFIGTTDGSGNATITISPIPISPGIASFTVGTNLFMDPGGASPITLLTNGPGTATLNRSTGVLTITGSNATTNVIYFPSLPVMGLEDLTIGINQFPGNIGFDTIYAYNISSDLPPSIYDVSFYKNPATGPYPGYVAKGTWTPTTWNGENYQQFWSVNYQGALWVTNGINISFTGSTIGMQFAPTSTITYNSNTATTINLTITTCPLVVGDFVFFNEWTGVNASTLNFQTGYVTSASSPGGTNTVVITLPNASLGAGPYTPGIVQYLTNRSNTGVDSIRWYDGDPTNGVSPLPSTTKGWVNFAPPLSKGIFSIADSIQAQYYLVGCRQIVPFKDRLLFCGAVIQSSTSAPIYLQDTIVYSENGTPYYTASFTGDPSAATTIFNPILTPNLTTTTTTSVYGAIPGAYWSDQSGFGGFISAGVDRPIITVASNVDSLIVGFDNIQTQVIYSGNDITPFNFYLINPELGSSSTFSQITMDKGVISSGNRGIIITNQRECQRIDLEIPDQIFEFNLQNNGTERVTAQRDFINEWLYLTYCADTDKASNYIFPNQTLQYNYRDSSWAIFNESYTTYGQFRPHTGLTWAKLEYTTWNDWTDPWNSGQSNLFQTQVIAGNQQGFIVLRAVGTSETTSLTIQNLSTGTVTSPNHSLNEGDYITIKGATGTVASSVNGLIFSVGTVIDANSFTLNPLVTGTYTGGGLITRMYTPFIQTKQFPVAWEMARKTRLGVQQYLLTTTANAQITLVIFLSQNNEFPYNVSDNSGLIYSTVLYTCPESTNLGLTAFNTNLQMLAVTQTGTSQQSQIWHRINTSLIGDTVQLGFTMSDAQMRSATFANQFSEIELHSFIIDCSPSQMLS